MAKKKPAPAFVSKPATEAQLSSFERNYASDPEIAARVLDFIGNKMTNARSNRLQYEDKWLSDIRQWSCQLDGGGYQGRASIFVPELHQQVESGVEKDLATMFPGSRALRTIPMNGTPKAKAEKIQNAVDYELQEKAHLYLKHQEFERQKRIKGTSVYKMGFKKKMRQVFFRDDNGKPRVEQIPEYHGVTLEVVDMFRWYIYPETATLENYKIIFEDQLRYKEDLEEEGIFVNLDQISSETIDPNHQWSDVEQLNIVNLASTIADDSGMCLVSEIWCDFELKKGQGRVPIQVFLGNSATPLLIRRNPFWDQLHPYLSDVNVKREGKIFYGFSMFDKLRSQGFQINDLNNQMMDSITYSLNPMVAIDPALAGDVNSFKVMPGAKWLGSPEGINMMAFPDVSSAGLRGIQEIRGQVGQFSDNSTGLAPQLEGKARSATQAQIVQTAVSQGQKTRATSEEYRVFKPMAARAHSLLSQYMEDDWQIKYAGASAGEWITDTIKPSDVVGEVDWLWATANQYEKTAVRAQQLLAFYNLALQREAMNPGALDLDGLFDRIANEAFDLDDIADFFKSLREKKTVAPEVENISLFDGEDVPVNNGDEDDAHMLIHLKIIESKDASPDAKLAALRHNEKHEAQKKAKKAVRELQAQLQMKQAMMQNQEATGGSPGQDPGGPQLPPSPLEGQSGQIAQGANSASEAGLMTGARATQPMM